MFNITQAKAMQFNTLDLDIDRIVVGLMDGQTKVRLNCGVEVYLTKHNFRRVYGYKRARELAKTIILALYQPVVQKPPKRSYKKRNVKVGRVVNGVRYIV